MEIFKGKKELKKSWVIELDDSNGCCLLAVDSQTGERIATVIYFHRDGKNRIVRSAHAALRKAGYDPHEHDNKFDSTGRMIFEKEE
jgi:hypothetical protein